MSIFPHMHLLGKDLVCYAITPTSDTINLIRINKWDFEWQGFYFFETFVKVFKLSFTKNCLDLIKDLSYLFTTAKVAPFFKASLTKKFPSFFFPFIAKKMSFFLTSLELILAIFKDNKGDNFFHGLNFSFAKQVIPNGRSKPLGTADAVITGLKSKPEWSGQKFTVCNSDNLYSVNVLKSLRKDKNLSSLIDYDRDSLGVEPKRVHAFAVIWKDNDGFLTDIVEKPDERQIKEATDKNGRIGVSMNIFKLDYDIIFPLLIETPINPKRDEKELTKTVRMLVDKYEKSVYTIPISERVPDLTTIKDVEDVETFIASKV